MTWAFGKAVEMKVRLLVDTVSGKMACVTAPAPSVTRTVNWKLPPVEVIPESVPFAVSEKPVGSWPATKLKLYGCCPPLAVIVVE